MNLGGTVFSMVRSQISLSVSRRFASAPMSTTLTAFADPACSARESASIARTSAPCARVFRRKRSAAASHTCSACSTGRSRRPRASWSRCFQRPTSPARRSPCRRRCACFRRSKTKAQGSGSRRSRTPVFFCRFSPPQYVKNQKLTPGLNAAQRRFSPRRAPPRQGSPPPFWLQSTT